MVDVELLICSWTNGVSCFQRNRKAKESVRISQQTQPLRCTVDQVYDSGFVFNATFTSTESHSTPLCNFLLYLVFVWSSASRKQSLREDDMASLAWLAVRALGEISICIARSLSLLRRGTSVSANLKWPSCQHGWCVLVAACVNLPTSLSGQPFTR